MVGKIARLGWPGALLFLYAALAGAQDGSLTASVDRNSIRANESFTYVLRAEGRIAGEPDISALTPDFDILNRSTSARIQTINGRTEQVVEYIYQLMPRTAGEFTLPPVELGGTMSNPITLEVMPALVESGDAPADIFMEVEVDPASAYVQAQVIYTLRLFVGVGIGRATLTQPLISGGEAIIERLGEDRQYQTVRGDRNFTVRERRYAIFPQASGPLTIGPASFEAMVIPNRGFSRVQRLRSETVSIDVKPAVAPPPTHPGAVWLPARRLTLTERWADTSSEFSLGVPRTRVLSIVADGLLETQLPELELGQSEGIRQYPDQPELGRQVTDAGLEATRTQRYAVIAQSAGEASIPAAELPWWNVQDERWEIARIDASTVRVLPGTEVAPATTEPSAAAPEPVVIETASGYWPWVAAVLGAGWLLTALGWWRSQRAGHELRARAAEPERVPSGRTLFRQLKAACAVGDAGRAQQLLLQWARLQFGDDAPSSLGALAEKQEPDLAAEIAALEGHLYGKAAGPWDGKRLAALLAELNTVNRAGKKTSDEALVPLYR